MIRISVDTEEELQIVRRVLKSEACLHHNCQDRCNCGECIDDYCKNRVALYKREVVEEPCPLVV